MTTTRALLAGHFSTIGDIESLEVVQSWLDDLAIPYDVAPFAESVRGRMPGSYDPTGVDARRYTHLLMICGPLWPQQLQQLQLDLERFRHCFSIGINLTLTEPLELWNPFDLLLERDSDRLTRPDLTLLAETPVVPVVGRCLVHKQSSYSGREQHDKAERLFNDLIAERDYAVIDLDTRWYREKNTLKSASHFLSVLRRVDLLLTNRLHGMVYALKAGVPVVAIDAIEGGAKVSAQAQILGWPQCIPIEQASPQRLSAAVDWCLSAEARRTTQHCREGALPTLTDIKQKFFRALLQQGER